MEDVPIKAARQCAGRNTRINVCWPSMTRESRMCTPSGITVHKKCLCLGISIIHTLYSEGDEWGGGAPSL
jgi:hypothetical protein